MDVSSDSKWRFTYYQKKDTKCDNFHMCIMSVMVILFCVSTIISLYHLFLVVRPYTIACLYENCVANCQNKQVRFMWCILLCVAPCTNCRSGFDIEINWKMCVSIAPHQGIVTLLSKDWSAFAECRGGTAFNTRASMTVMYS